MQIILKGKIGQEKREKGEKPVFFSLPKPSSYNFFFEQTSEVKIKTLKWSATWNDEKDCQNILITSKRKVSYWTTIYELYTSMEQKYSNLNHIDYLIRIASRQVKKWKRTTNSIQKQLNN